MTGNSKAARLLQWAAENHLQIDSRLDVRDNADTSISVFCRRELADPIPCNETLVRIPKSAVLSVKSCRLASYMSSVSYGHGAQLALSLALYTELRDRENSKWGAYLDSLPAETVGIALLWDASPGQGRPQQRVSHLADQYRYITDHSRARAWIVGTQVEKEIYGKDGTNMLGEIRQYYKSVVEPLLRAQFPEETPSLDGFLHAYSLVSSRAFIVDAFHGLSMVPIADAFNHAQENHVHLESDYHVCPTCGSTEECPHDEGVEATTHFRSGSPALNPIQPPRSSHEAHFHTENEETYDMVSNAPVLSGEEVFNTYGEDLCNAQLLARYGFALECNDNDVVTWGLDELELYRQQMASKQSERGTIGSIVKTITRVRGSGSSVSGEGELHRSDSSSYTRSIGFSAKEAGGGDHGLDEIVLDLWTKVVQVWPGDKRWSDSMLVYNLNGMDACLPPSLSDFTAEDDDGDVHNHSKISASVPGSSRFDTSSASTTTRALCLNSDGRVSHHLWLYCALLNLEDHLLHARPDQKEARRSTPTSSATIPVVDPTVALGGRSGKPGALVSDASGVQKIVELLQRVAMRQQELEREVEEAMDVDSDGREVCGDDKSGVNGPSGVEAREEDGGQQQQRVQMRRTTAGQILLHGTVCAEASSSEREELEQLLTTTVAGIARTVSSLCRSRADCIGGVWMGVDEDWGGRLDDVLDNLEDDMIMTKAAVMVAASERSVLESSVCEWETFGDVVDSL